MDKPHNKSDPERTARKIVMDCADCDCCRPIMDESCLFFPELYRLYDQEVESGLKISAEELRQLVEKCNYCALCPCPNIRAEIIRAKTRFIERDGLKSGVRTVEDVERVGKLCGALIFNYAETDELQTLEMLYDGEELSMLVLLPKDGDLGFLEGSLTVKKLNQWKMLLKRQRVDVYMPRFTFDKKYFLNENLKEIGMLSAFTPPNQPSGANFSGISGKKDLYIQLVVHQAFVDINDEGTEAAAATGVSVGITSLPRVPVFRADHPFIFLIQERENGNILFMGRVVNPEEGNL